MSSFKNSFYNQSFPIQLKSYDGPQYSKFAVIFPGQGSLNLNEYSQHLKKITELKKYIQIVDSFIEDKLTSKVIWYLTDQSKISKNEYAVIQNLFLFSLNVAYFDFLVMNKKPDCLTAHSFGEYAALVCGGVLSFDQMLPIVYFREVYSPMLGEAGTLLAASIDLVEAKKIAADLGIEIANINSPRQVVFAVTVDQLKIVKKEFKINKIAYRVLDQVGRPYHSQLMLETASQLRQEIIKMNLSINPLRYRFFSSVSHQQYPVGYLFAQSEFIDLLTSQLTTTLNFNQLIQEISQLGIRSYLDLSQSGIYRNFVAEILKDKIDQISNQVIHQMAFVDQQNKSDQLFHLDLENNPLFKTISKYIAQVTGYELVEIGINDYFQEDLRIDSIKKAEIVFKTLQETNLNIEESLTLAQLRRVGDVVKYLEQRKENPTQNKLNYVYQQDAFYRFSLGTRNLSTSYFSVNKNQNIQKIILNIADGPVNQLDMMKKFFNTDYSLKKQLIIDLMNMQHHSSINDQFSILFVWIDLIKNQFPDGSQSNHHILLTCYSIGHSFRELPFVQFFRSVAIECGLRFQWIQDCDQQIELEHISHFYDDELHEHIQLIDGEYKTREFIFLDTDDVHQSKNKMNKNHVLAIGGSRGLCFQLLLQQNSLDINQLTIVGRTSASDNQIQKQLKKLAKKYEMVSYIQADCTVSNEFNKLLELHQKNSFDLILHAAGVEKSEKLLNKELHQITAELNTKILVSDQLARFFPNVPQIHFSSIVGLIGNEGQTVYSFANAWLADMENRFLMSLIKVIFWPAINQIGMTNNPGLYQKMKSNGVQFLDVQLAVQFFEQILVDFLVDNNKQPTLIAHLKDLSLMQYQMIDWKKWSHVWGQLVDPERMIYQQRHSLEDSSYLLDHRLESMSVVPASAVLSQLASYGIKYLNDFLTIHHFNIQNMLMVLPGKETFSHSQFYHHCNNKEHVIDFRMFTQLEHFSANMSRHELESDSETVDQVLNIDRMNDVLSVDLNTFYSQECIDFGYKFQVFDQLEYFHDQIQENIRAIGKIKKTPIYFTGESLSDRMMMMIEAGFQTASMFGVVAGQRLGIPLSVGKIHIHLVGTGHATCIVRAHKKITLHAEDEMMFHVLIVNDQGEVIIEMSELVLSPIRSHPTLPFRWKETNNSHEL